MKPTEGLQALRRTVPAPVRTHLGRLRRRPVAAPRGGYRNPPDRPIGVKFELTHRCNLLCSFCYTDSPAKTLTKTYDRDHDEWMAIVEQSIDLGIVEAVVSGGEPLLRKALTLDIMRRLDAVGVNSILTTNGWFLDDEAATVIAGLRHAKVGISIDGLTPELHDAGRGVAGSWERAVAGLDRLIARGTDVRVNHVVTPTNEAYVGEFLDALWEFGVRTMRIAPTLTTGAATRGGSWEVDTTALARTFNEFRRKHPESNRVLLRQAEDAGSVDYGSAPDVMLVRPDGAVVIDSQRPLCFGNALVDGLAGAWSNIRASWQNGEFAEMATRTGGHIPYRDPDLVVAGTAPRPSSRPIAEPTRTIPLGLPAPVAAGGDVRAARTHLRTLADARLLQTAAHRWAGDRDGTRLIRTAAGTKHVIPPQHARVMDVFCTPMSVADAIEQLDTSGGTSVGTLESGTRPLSETAVRSIVQSLRERRLLVFPHVAPRQRRDAVVDHLSDSGDNPPGTTA